jgi:putative transposase
MQPKVKSYSSHLCAFTQPLTTVGRIISKLIKTGTIRAVHTSPGRRHKKRRVFNKHANRWKYGMKGKKPGELIQIDHMSVYSPGIRIKHFKAICPVTRIMVAYVFSCATSKIAAKFLDYLIKEMSFQISSIQVDGGSEFMKDFEKACLDKGIELFVLPPRKPKYNGTVERTNGITRDEFYWFYTDTYDTGTVKALKDIPG